MHKEFAVDPNAVSSWERLLILSNCVGFEKGRVVVGCPAKIQWYRSVLKNLTTTEDKTNKIVEKLAHLFFEKKAVVTKEMSGWDSDEEWLLNVIREDEKLKGGLCDGIVTKEADPDRPKVVGFDSLDNENPVWRCVPGKAPRTSESIVKAARILLRYSSDIVLIDPYINPNRESYARPLRSLLDEIFSSSPRLKHDRHPVKRLECHISIHTDHSRSLCPDGVRSLYSDKFSRHIPAGHSLVIRRWRKGADKMHARYILTELGGISYDHGLDEGDGTTDVQLMSEQLRRERWNDFVLNPTLNLADKEPIAIAGQRWGST